MLFIFKGYVCLLVATHAVKAADIHHKKALDGVHKNNIIVLCTVLLFKGMLLVLGCACIASEKLFLSRLVAEACQIESNSAAVQVNALRVLQYFPPSEDPAIVNKLFDILGNIINGELTFVQTHACQGLEMINGL